MNSTHSRLISTLFSILLSIPGSAQESPRLSSVLTNSLRLGPITEKKAPNNDNLRYGVVFPFQVGPTTAAAFINREVYTANWNYDSQDGNDVILFDNLEEIDSINTINLNRSGASTDDAGNSHYFNQFPVVGGFVPYGAKVGSAVTHPYAGTGFGISQALIFPVAPDGTFSWDSAPISRQVQVFQFSYQGDDFRVLSTSIKSETDPLRVPNSPWIILSGGISMAIPDGLDLLLPVWAWNGANECSGISR
ncbi:hypothetical protein [Geothrix sp. 21YS21S-4]|uniref:hypothetical protein n=1 Tax=Geothrix sp. 21YS21S-4 TaxID=3068889 RepID=UPI0027B9950D|nr:hypothetical protein [Geothrix sp. 21YS21S-4]